MDDRDIERLPEDVLAHLASRRDPAPSAAAEARMREHLMATLGPGILDGPSELPITPPSATAPVLANHLAALGLAFAVGAVVGGSAVFFAVSKPATTLDTPAPISDAPSISDALDTDAALSNPVIETTEDEHEQPSSQTSTLSTRPGTDDESGEGDAAVERRLLERARTALARGQWTSALSAVRAHETRFPRGRLIEEREAIAIQALAASGEGNEARRRAGAFHARFPRSLFSGVIERATTTAP